MPCVLGQSVFPEPKVSRPWGNAPSVCLHQPQPGSLQTLWPALRLCCCQLSRHTRRPQPLLSCSDISVSHCHSLACHLVPSFLYAGCWVCSAWTQHLAQKKCSINSHQIRTFPEPLQGLAGVQVLLWVWSDLAPGSRGTAGLRLTGNRVGMKHHPFVA